MKELKISAIRDGTVIDHIPAEYTYEVVKLLNLKNMDGVTSIASNLFTKKFDGKKGIVKIGGKHLCEQSIAKIAIIAPHATVCYTKDYKVIKKTSISIPDEIHDIVKCFNPKCITNFEETKNIFYVKSKDPVVLRCHYCEKDMEKKEIKLKNN